MIPRSLLATATALTGLACVTAAQAADLPIYTKAPPVVAVAPSWTGFYIGGAVGSGMVVHDVGVAFGGGTFGLDGIGGRGFLASGYVGFDFQFAPRWVIGIMADGTWSNIGPELEAAAPGLAVDASIRADVSWSVLGRLGFLTSPSTLWYVLGGYTWQNFNTEFTATAGGPPVTFEQDDGLHGWTVGVGIERRLWWPGWTIKTEYRFTQFETANFLGGALGIQPSMHTLRSGLTYRFGGASLGGAAPVFAEPRPNWTGFYLGVAGGVGAVVHEVNVALGGANIDFDGLGGEGLLGSVYGGFDFQFGSRFLVGVMADGTWSNVETTADAAFGGGALSASVRADKSWSVLARLGYLSSPSTLWYVGGGYTWQNFRIRANAPGLAFADNESLDGLTGVGGIETMLTGNWAAKLEYRYSFFEEADFFGGALAVKPTVHTVRAGLSYKFNWASPPISASY